MTPKYLLEIAVALHDVKPLIKAMTPDLRPDQVARLAEQSSHVMTVNEFQYGMGAAYLLHEYDQLPMAVRSVRKIGNHLQLDGFWVEFEPMPVPVE